jgi:hypothetical protein
MRGCRVRPAHRGHLVAYDVTLTEKERAELREIKRNRLDRERNELIKQVASEAEDQLLLLELNHGTGPSAPPYVKRGTTRALEYKQAKAPAPPGKPGAAPIDYAALARELRRYGKGKPAALVEFMERRDSATYDDVKCEVMGNEDVEDSAVRKLMSRTNKLLVALGSPLYFRVSAGLVFKGTRPQ